MKDPLTAKEKKLLFANFRAEWERTYKAALSSGAIAGAEKGDHSIAKMYLLIAAKGYLPLSAQGRKDFKNLEHFV